MVESSDTLVGLGLYTVSEAARLTRIPRQSIRRWLTGYHYRRGDTQYESPPVLSPQISPDYQVVGLGFLDLMEARFIHAFRQFGVSLRVIRLAIDRSRDIFRTEHPFASHRFLTDGKKIFADLVGEIGERKLLDMSASQYAFRRVISASLYASLDFTADDQVARWFPMPKHREIVVDPERAFGRPILAEYGVPTESLANAAEVEESADRAARWFDVPVGAVNLAVEFENQLGA